MKIAISFPPIESEKGIPLLTQNRQFQWFSNPTYIYPVIPAYAATLLKENGYEVFWDDGIAEGLSYKKWLDRIIAKKPDIIAIETKTPVIKRHWEIINELKKRSLKIGNWKLEIVLMGDHVTAMPEESLKNSQVDFVICGGDYDFILLNLCQNIENCKLPRPASLGVARKIKNYSSGIWYKNGGIVKNTGVYDLHNNSLDKLPMIDRELTNWRLYAYKNGNFKYTPGSYVMNGRDCWWGQCAFCSWTTLFPGKNFRKRSVEKALDEIGHLIDLGIKEVMEDSGSLPIGDWLIDFCQGMIEHGYNKKITMGCNMRINGIKNPETWELMRKAGFRFVLFGLESANQITLDKINKNLKVEEIEPGLKMCKQAGLEPHITAMIGYPWESKEDAKRTIELAKNLFKKGYIDSLQATIVIPYPGTPLYKYCQENNLFNFHPDQNGISGGVDDYDRFDQREQVMKSELSTEDVKELTQKLYKSFVTPNFIAKKILRVRNFADIRFLFRAGLKVLGHLADFK